MTAKTAEKSAANSTLTIMRIAAEGQETSRRARLVSLLLAAIVLGLYSQTLGHEFVNYDDHRYVTRNPHVMQGLTIDTVIWAFTSLEVANWHPLTWLSHMLDVELFGFDHAGGHHLVNVALHAANAAILLLLLYRMTGALWRSALVAAVFAMHPLRVESVAWVSERKDVLSVLFGLLAIWMYVSYTAGRRWRMYVGALALFACSLMSKPMLVTLPALLLVLDWWPLGRVVAGTRSEGSDQPRPGQSTRIAALVIEKLPFLALSIGSSIITMMAQTRGGAVAGIDAVPLGARLANAIVAYAMYLRQMIWPVNLAPLYPRPESWSAVVIVASLVILIAVSIVVGVFSRRRPAVVVGWLWFLGTLVPVIGIIQIGSHAHADRYTYLPSIGVMIMVAWSIPAARDRRVASAYAALAAVALSMLAALTWLQARHWRDSIALSTHALRVTSRNAIAHFNLANALNERGQSEAAIEHFQQAADIMPRWSDVPFNLANTYLRLRQFDRAIEWYDRALQIDPHLVRAHINRSIALAQRGDVDEAIAGFSRAIEIDPHDADAHRNLAQALVQAEQLDLAIDHYRRALELHWPDATTHLLLGNALAMKGELHQAMQHLEIALDLNPRDPRAHMSMAAALTDAGQPQQALAHLQAAAELAQAAGNQQLLTEIQTRARSMMQQPSP